MKRILCVSIGLVLLIGCGAKPQKGGSVEGSIQYKGRPVNGAALRLHPVSGEGDDVTINVSQEGTFGASDVPPGEYAIVVESEEIPPETMERMKGPKIAKGMDPSKAKEMQDKFQQQSSQKPVATIPYPRKYRDVNGTDLKCTITKGKKESLKLDLKD